MHCTARAADLRQAAPSRQQQRLRPSPAPCHPIWISTWISISICPTMRSQMLLRPPPAILPPSQPRAPWPPQDDEAESYAGLSEPESGPEMSPPEPQAPVLDSLATQPVWEVPAAPAATPALADSHAMTDLGMALDLPTLDTRPNELESAPSETPFTPSDSGLMEFEW